MTSRQLRHMSSKPFPESKAVLGYQKLRRASIRVTMSRGPTDAHIECLTSMCASVGLRLHCIGVGTASYVKRIRTAGLPILRIKLMNSLLLVSSTILVLDVLKHDALTGSPQNKYYSIEHVPYFTG